MNTREQFKDSYIVNVGSYALSKDNYHIVYWSDDDPQQWFTLAIFEPHKEGYELRFVGSRPFEYSWCKEISFMEFAAGCQKYMNGVFDLQEMERISSI